MENRDWLNISMTLSDSDNQSTQFDYFQMQDSLSAANFMAFVMEHSSYLSPEDVYV